MPILTSLWGSVGQLTGRRQMVGVRLNRTQSENMVRPHLGRLSLSPAFLRAAGRENNVHLFIYLVFMNEKWRGRAELAV